MKINILAVDDREENLFALVSLLENPGLNIVTAGSGNEALGLMLEQDFALVLLDVQMPEMDGFEVAELMRSMEATKTIPIIFVTAISKESEYVFKGYESGAVDYLFKPLDPNVVRSKVRIFCELHRKKVEIEEANQKLGSMVEQLRKAKETAEKATKIKDEFVSLVAHDLKSPLASIIGILRFISEDNENGLTEQYVEVFSNVVKSGGNLLQMIDEILNLQRLQAGNVLLKRNFFDAYYLCATIMDNNRYYAAEKKVELINDIELGTRAYADISLFGEVIQNLVSNAVKFSNTGGKIRIYRPEGRPNCIAIKDYGVGIPGNTVPDLFKHEIKTTTLGTKGEHGTGFGLPYCFDIMKVHGGDLTVESKEGKGTSFVICLPSVTPKILIVDDEKNIRLLFNTYLRELGVTAMEAKSGKEALKILREENLHLIISDLVMTSIDGLDLLSEVRRVRTTKDVPFIVVSTNIEENTRNKAIHLGANDFIDKSINKDDFLAIIKKYII